ncbi:hypothetical protein CS022_13990 [Veronia nyctiphanis]|uniref:Uncharacterized protein n=1 Tax=Veronia nyctiphanis TaxID=1278244 RepID=A0A4Q0YP78_9GAMM|nr:hypothetical protein CS022_13990 [Veronia nyctiphanis]
MGTEIIVITIANLLITAYALVVRIIHFTLVKTGVVHSDPGLAYKTHAVVILCLALLPSLAFLWVISADYVFAIGYILIIQLPIILLTMWLLMSFSAWKNITRQ